MNLCGKRLIGDLPTNSHPDRHGWFYWDWPTDETSSISYAAGEGGSQAGQNKYCGSV